MQVRILRPVHVRGAVAQPGEILDTDPIFAAELVHGNKAEFVTAAPEPEAEPEQAPVKTKKAKAEPAPEGE